MLFCIALLLALLLPCLAQEAIVDDDHAWNSFFRDSQGVPQFPFPGTLNNIEWDQYAMGFPPSLWDTKDFVSIIQMKPIYVSGSYGHLPFLWENFWAFFEIFLESYVKFTQTGSRFEWMHLKIQNIWDVYITLLKEMYCCPHSKFINGTFAFGCMDHATKNECCRPENPMGTCTDIGTQFIKAWSSQSLQALKVKFYVWLCIIYANQPFIDLYSRTEAVQELLKACPNPCRSDPCSDLPNAEAGSCLQFSKPLGFYRNKFICRCRKKFFFDMYTNQCQQQPMCNMNACNSAGTRKCIDKAQGFQCLCKPGYSGTRCNAPMNSCQKRRQASDISGNIACRTSLGNQCVSRTGQDLFYCICIPPYQRETDTSRLAAAFRMTATNISSVAKLLPPDNCMAKVDACERVSCGSDSDSGRCMPSGDLLAFVCVCKKNEDGYPLFEGEYCEISVSQWRDWSHWSVCRPECGDSCFQARQRLCSHMDGQAYCKGADEELRACEPACRPCPNRSFAHLSGVFIKETATPLLLAVLSLFLVQLLLLTAIDWFFSPDVSSPL
ncbi:hypothetical protein BOX15_Mlig019184g3 [Macrostomum lignano]|uniref:EGF-like domain-containing protein n=1 Tax=Macrostomum lignano TaxID=282301 RepID=A0A267DDS3_9PLAT|nr:hypothetical protein BOX15_Mlig019184g3 [Macrostomum lignano]